MSNQYEQIKRKRDFVTQAEKALKDISEFVHPEPLSTFDIITSIQDENPDYTLEMAFVLYRERLISKIETARIRLQAIENQANTKL